MYKYNTHFDRIAQDTALSVAKEVYRAEDRKTTSTHYHATNVNPFWVKHYKLDGKVGNHVFYTNDTPYK
jgi:spore germination cell wall hydrolase CwlJ-like protein